MCVGADGPAEGCHTGAVNSPAAPPRFPPLAKLNWAGRLLARLGWRLDLPPPPGPKVLVVFYPHTSNWDFPLGLLARFACGWPVHWVGKHTLFRWPLGALMRRLGGIPIDRAAPGGFIDAIVAEFGRRDRLMVAMAPEGTRRFVPALKSGFYRIALAAQVPIGLAYFDYRSRTIGIAGYFVPSGEREADLEIMRAAYAGKRGCRPDQAGVIGFG